MKNGAETGKAKSGRYAAVGILAVLALAVALRAPFLQERTFFIDEAFSYVLAGHSAGEVLAGSASESNPPLPVLLFHAWQLWAGREWELRLLSVLLSLAAVAGVYAFGAGMGGRRAGLIAGLITAASVYQVNLAQVYRYPALAVFVATGCFHFYWRWLDRGRARDLWLAALFFALGLYTHYFFIFVVLSANLFAVGCFAKRPRRLLHWFVSQLAVAAAFAPWLLVFVGQSGGELAPVGVEALARHLKTFPFLTVPNVLQAFCFGDHAMQGRAGLLALGALVYALLFLRLLAHHDPLKKWFLIVNIFAGLGLPWVMMLLLGLRLQLMYFCVFSCLLYVAFGLVLGGGGGSKQLRSVTGAALAALMVFSLVFHYTNLPADEDNKTIIKYIEQNAAPADVVVLNPTYQGWLFEYYARRDLRLFGIPKQFDVLNYNFGDVEQVTAERLDEMDRLVQPGGRVWGFFGFGTKTKPDQGELTIKHLRENYRLVEERRFTPVSFALDAGLLAVYEKR